jgi:hypothetical protein
MIEGSGRPKHMWIQIRIRIRIRNTAFRTGSWVIGEEVIGDLGDRWRGQRKEVEICGNNVGASKKFHIYRETDLLPYLLPIRYSEYQQIQILQLSGKQKEKYHSTFS